MPEEFDSLYEKVRHYFKYVDGELVWNAPKKRATVGKIAGCVRPDGYKHIGLDGKLYFVHRLVWLYHNGSLPECGLDHINRDITDNRIENLRVAEQWQNRGNSVSAGKSKDLPKGVHQTSAGSYFAMFRNKSLGTYKTPEEAFSVYENARNKYYGEFAYNE